MFLDVAKFSDFWWQNPESAELKECVTWFVHFFYLPLVWYNCAKSHHCRICLADLRERGPKSSPPHPWAAPKKPILNRVKEATVETGGKFSIIYVFITFFANYVYCKVSIMFLISFVIIKKRGKISRIHLFNCFSVFKKRD